MTVAAPAAPGRLRLHTRPETADILRMHVRTLDAHIAEGRIRATRLGQRVLVSAEEIERLIAEGIGLDARTEGVQ